MAGTDPVVAPQRPRRPRISVVVPALNEARNVREVLPTLPEVHEVILVDGGSVDGTVEAARATLPEVVTLTQLRTGKGNALTAGFARVTGDVVVMFDADGSADAEEIPRFVAALLDGADLARGSRFRPRGCTAFWADLIPVLDLPDHERVTPSGSPMLWGDGFEIETLITCRVATAGLSITEVPSVEKARRHGRSCLRAVTDGWRVLRTLRTERARVRRSARLDQALLERPDSA